MNNPLKNSETQLQQYEHKQEAPPPPNTLLDSYQ